MLSSFVLPSFFLLSILFLLPSFFLLLHSFFLSSFLLLFFLFSFFSRLLPSRFFLLLLSFFYFHCYRSSLFCSMFFLSSFSLLLLHFSPFFFPLYFFLPPPPWLRLVPPLFSRPHGAGGVQHLAATAASERRLPADRLLRQCCQVQDHLGGGTDAAGRRHQDHWSAATPTF